MNLSWQIVRLNLKEKFSIAYGNYLFREALIVSLKYNNFIGYGECTAIDYYQINLKGFVEKLNLIKKQIEFQKINHPIEFYTFLLKLELPNFLRSALDCAYWDLFGKLEKKSFLELNKVIIKKLPESSITISVDIVENQIEKIKKSSWKNFKVKCNHFDKKNFKKLALIDNTLALDSNASFTIDDCNYIANNPLSKKIIYFEQPIKTGFENYSNLQINDNANWMADEDCQDQNDLKNLKNHYQTINIKLMKCGGLTPALNLINEALKMNFKLMIGCMTESTIGISAAAVLAPFCNYADLDGANLIANDIAKGSQIINGKIQLSEKPGLGIELI